MKLKARWGGGRFLFPRSPAGFCPAPPVPAHPAPPAAHPEKDKESTLKFRTNTN